MKVTKKENSFWITVKVVTMEEIITDAQMFKKMMNLYVVGGVALL